MKIKIIDAKAMGVEHHYGDGDITNVTVTDAKYPYTYNSNTWLGKYFEVVGVESQEKPTKQASTTTLQRIQTFTMNHKNLEISFEDGMIIMRDFTPSFEPDEYRCDTIEQLEELMGAWEKISKFKKGD